MRNLCVWVTKNRKKAWFSLGLNLVIMAGIFIVMMPFYETNDDLTMCEFIDGSWGTTDGHLVFQNYILGVFYQFLYRLPIRLPWYALFQYFVLWLSFSAVTYVILQRLKTGSGICVALVLMMYFSYECYVKLQFSKVAGIAAAAGLFLLLYAVTRERLSFFLLLNGWLLGCVGSMFRFDEFLACAALMTGIGVWLLLELRKREKGKCLKRLGRYAGVFGLMLFFAVILRMYDHSVYARDPLWVAYNEYNDIRCELQDYGFPDYQTHQEVFESLGLNEDAYKLFAFWNINDPEQFPVEVMKELTKLQPERELNSELAAGFFREVPKGFFQTHVFYCVLILAVFWLLWGGYHRSEIFVILYEMLIFGMIYFYLYYAGRYLINRVDVGLWFSVALVLIWMMDSGKMKFTWQNGGIFCLCLFLVNQGIWSNDWRINSGHSLEIKAGERAILEEISSDKEHLYLAKINTLSGGNSFGPFDRLPEGLLDNISWLGGWETNSAVGLQVLENWGITNPYRDMIGNPDVYLIDRNIKLTLRYLQTYYDENATATLVKRVGGLNVYKIGGSNETADTVD